MGILQTNSDFSLLLRQG